jgi:hypothetical protein
MKKIEIVLNLFMEIIITYKINKIHLILLLIYKIKYSNVVNL